LSVTYAGFQNLKSIILYGGGVDTGGGGGAKYTPSGPL